MKTLIVGGTGLTGACTAKYLREQGHDVTLMSRNKPAAPPLSEFEHIAASYFESDINEAMLEDFDWLVFAAGADIRMHPQTESDEVFFTRANSEGVPNFFAKAKAAGIKRAAYLGTYYPQIVPEQIDKSERLLIQICDGLQKLPGLRRLAPVLQNNACSRYRPKGALGAAPRPRAAGEPRRRGSTPRAIELLNCDQDQIARRKLLMCKVKPWFYPGPYV